VTALGAVLDALARWPLALTPASHFFFVPLTVGLAFLTAPLQAPPDRKGWAEPD
jgi:cytochrome bd-type quinol oxidase subunit 1